MSDKEKNKITTKKIGIVGTGAFGLNYSSIASKFPNAEIIVINDKGELHKEEESIPTITINGIAYKEREKPKKNKVVEINLRAYDESTYKRERPDINLEAEFELIDNKQSKLSRNDRDWVISTFNKKYIKIETK